MADHIGTVEYLRMHIEPFDPHNAGAMTELATLREACRAHDRPDYPYMSATILTASMTAPQPRSRAEYWAARLDDGTLVGFVDLMLPQAENRETAFSDGYVHPRHRRQGIGTALYRHVADRMRELGRSRLIPVVTDSIAGGTATSDGAGPAFAEHMGMQRALVEHRSRLTLTDADDQRWDALSRTAWEKAQDYEIITWKDRADDSIAEDMAKLECRLELDIPTGDLGWEPAEYDVARWREREDMGIKRLRTLYYAAARHKPSGILAAYTGFLLPQSPRTHAWQITTVVADDHRGHRLGLLVKLANIAAARKTEPDLRYIDTNNAESNAHMIAVNDALGFELCDADVEYLATFE